MGAPFLTRDIFIYAQESEASLSSVTFKRLPTVSGVKGYLPHKGTGDWYAVKTGTVRRIYAFKQDATAADFSADSSGASVVEVIPTLAYVRLTSSGTLQDDEPISTTPASNRPVLVLARVREALSIDIENSEEYVEWTPMGDKEASRKLSSVLRRWTMTQLFDPDKRGWEWGERGELLRVDVTAGGSGYTTPTLTFTGGGGGSGAAGTIQVTSGSVTGVTLTSTGQGYTTAPTAVIGNAGSGSGATLAPVVDFGAYINDTMIFSANFHDPKSADSEGRYVGLFKQNNIDLDIPTDTPAVNNVTLSVVDGELYKLGLDY